MSAAMHSARAPSAEVIAPGRGAIGRVLWTAFRRYHGVLVTVAAHVLLEVAARLGLAVPNPVPVLLTAVVYAGLSGGFVSGAASAALSLLYSAVSLSTGGQIGQYTPENARRLAVVAVATPSIALMVGVMKCRADRALAALQREVAGRKRAEEEIRALNEQLEARVRERTAELARAMDELAAAQRQATEQERLRALGQMASGIAHDFNNALALIVGYTELLLARRDGMDEAVRAELQLVRSAAQGAAAVVARLRDFYRPREAGEVLEPVAANDLIAQVISLTQPRWRDQPQAAGVTIRLATELADVPPVAGNAAELRDALTNLIFNAVDAMPEGGTLCVRSRSEGGHVLIEVADTGVGIPFDVQARIFEPFFTTKGEHGSGLGLAMVYGIVRRHGGSIGLDSAPGQGSVFTIRLPVLEDGAIPHAPEAPPTADRSLRVLVAEDEPSLRTILVNYLRIDGHTVVAVAHGREALDQFRSGSFDLILTDRAMPEMGGDQLVAAIRREAPHVPIIMLTGLGELMDAVAERSEGVDLVVSKPITLAGMREAIARVLTASASK